MAKRGYAPVMTATATRSLTSREMQLLVFVRHHPGSSYVAMGKRLGVSPERAQVVAETLNKLGLLEPRPRYKSGRQVRTNFALVPLATINQAVRALERHARGSLVAQRAHRKLAPFAGVGT
jgi:hypothetical protein